jgi:hypothetical protein
VAKTSGGQLNNKNGARATQARNALELALRNNGEPVTVAQGVQCLVDIWNEAIKQAKEGNTQAINMIMDRLDGKPGQSIMLSGDEDNPVAVTQVERIIVKPSNPDS